MEELIEILSDDDTVVKGYIAVARANINGHKYLGQHATVSISVNYAVDTLESDDLLWCYLEKERGKAPVLYPVVSQPEDD